MLQTVQGHLGQSDKALSQNNIVSREEYTRHIAQWLTLYDNDLGSSPRTTEVRDNRGREMQENHALTLGGVGWWRLVYFPNLKNSIQFL